MPEIVAHFKNGEIDGAPVKMLGRPETDSTAAPSSNSNSNNVAQLLRDARELVMQCRAAPSLTTGMYDEMMVAPVTRGIGQLEAASARLASEVSTAPSSRAGALLASKGIDAGRLQESLMKLDALPTTALTKSSPVDPTDLDSFIESRFESCVLDVVEGLQERVRVEAEKLVKQAKEANWERLKRLYLEKRQIVIQSNAVSGAASNSTMGIASSTGPATLVRRAKPMVVGTNSRAEAFLHTTQLLNEARLTDSSFSPAFAFRSDSSGDAEDQLLRDCWEALGMLAGEEEPADSKSNVFLTKTQSTWAESYQKGTAEWSGRLVDKSRKFLEISFARYMDATIAQYPREALLGGQPGPISRARAFASIKAKRLSQSDLQALDLIPHGDAALPYWLVLWVLLRAGQAKAAYDFASSPEVEPFIERSEPRMLSYLKGFVQGTLTGPTQAQLASDYADRSLASGREAQDPYKLALMKVIGRCDPSKRSLPNVVQTSEDYLWLQLCMVPPSMASDNLAALQKTVLGYGRTHFDPKGTAPLRYAHVLLLVGLYSQAVSLLYDQAAYQLDALHMAITLAYHGMLHVLPRPGENLWDLSVDESNLVQLNFGLMLSQAAKRIAGSFDTLAGLQYVFCLSLVSWIPEYPLMARQLVREVVLESGEAASLLGDIQQDGSLRPGFLPRHARLLGLDASSTSFMDEIAVKAAEQCERQGRISDALQLYNLASQYTRVLHVLLKKLQAAVAGPYQSDDLGTTVGTAEAILQFYRSHERIRSQLDPVSLDGCSTLIALAQLRKAVEEENWSVAVSVLESQPISEALFPLNMDSTAITRATERLRSPTLPSHLAAILPDALLLAMQALHGRFHSLRQFAFIDPGRQSELDRIRKQARSAMLMVGLLRMRIQPELCAQLTRLDIMMN